MSVRYGVFGMAALSLAAAGFVTSPVRAFSQAPAGGAGETNDQSKLISLDLESTDLYAALTLLFKQAKANYTLDPNLRGTLVTVHVKLPFKQALETVLKTSGLPYTYQFENNVYSVVPIKETPAEAALPTDTTVTDPAVAQDTDDTPIKLLLGTNIINLNGLDIAEALGGKSQLFTSGYSGNYGYNPFAGSQSGGGGAGGGQGGFGGGNTGGFGGGSTGGFGGGSSGGFGGSSGGFGGSQRRRQRLFKRRRQRRRFRSSLNSYEQTSPRMRRKKMRAGDGNVDCPYLMPMTIQSSGATR